MNSVLGVSFVVLLGQLWSFSACTALSLSRSLVAYLKDIQLKLTTYSY